MKIKNTQGNKALVILILAIILGGIGFYFDKKMTGPDGLTPSGAKGGKGFTILGIVAALIIVPALSDVIFAPKTVATKKS